MTAIFLGADLMIEEGGLSTLTPIVSILGGATSFFASASFFYAANCYYYTANSYAFYYSILAFSNLISYKAYAYLTLFLASSDS
jgi:hypothetical protein